MLEILEKSPKKLQILDNIILCQKLLEKARNTRKNPKNRKTLKYSKKPKKVRNTRKPPKLSLYLIRKYLLRKYTNEWVVMYRKYNTRNTLKYTHSCKVYVFEQVQNKTEILRSIFGSFDKLLLARMKASVS